MSFEHNAYNYSSGEEIIHKSNDNKQNGRNSRLKRYLEPYPFGAACHLNNNALGRGGGHTFHQEFGGGGPDVFHWFLLSLKVKASGGPSPRPPMSQMLLPTISNIQNEKRLQNKLMYCGVTMYPKTLAFYLFIVRFR